MRSISAPFARQWPWPRCVDVIQSSRRSAEQTPTATRLLADVEVREARHLRAAVQLVRLLLEEPDAASSAGTSRAQAPRRPRCFAAVALMRAPPSRRRTSPRARRRATAKSRSPMPMPFAAVRSSFVTAVVGSGTSTSPAELEGEVHVLLHHVAVEPHLVGMAEHERAAVRDHRRRDHRREHHLDGALARDARLLGEQHALAEREHLHGELRG